MPKNIKKIMFNLILIGSTLFIFPLIIKSQVMIERAEAVCSQQTNYISEVLLFLDKSFTVNDNLLLAQKHLKWAENLSGEQYPVVKNNPLLTLDTVNKTYISNLGNQVQTAETLKTQLVELGKVQDIVIVLQGLIISMQNDFQSLDENLSGKADAKTESERAKRNYARTNSADDDAAVKNAEGRIENNDSQAQKTKEKLVNNFDLIRKIYKISENDKTGNCPANAVSDDEKKLKTACDNLDLAQAQKQRLENSKTFIEKAKTDLEGISFDQARIREDRMLIDRAQKNLESGLTEVENAVNFDVATAIAKIKAVSNELSSIVGTKAIGAGSISQNFYIFKQSDENRPVIFDVETSELEFDDYPEGYAPNLIKLKLKGNGIQIETDKTFYVVASKVNFNGEAVKGLLQKQISFAEPCLVKKPDPEKPTNSFYKRKESKGKDDSDFYFEGQMYGVREAKGFPIFKSVDIRASVPFLRPLKKDYELVIFGNARLVTDPKSDPSSVEVGIKLFHSHAFRVQELNSSERNEGKRFPRLPLIPGFRYEVGIKGEATQNIIKLPFLNGTAFGRIYFPSNIVDSENVLLQINPFVGSELGVNFKNIVADARRKPLARIWAGATFKFNPFRNREKAPVIFEGNYEYRYLFLNEVSVTKDDDNNFIPNVLGKGSRHFIEFNLKFPISKYFQPFLEYKFGKLPPTFELFDHKFGAGIRYNFGFNRN